MLKEPDIQKSSLMSLYGEKESLRSSKSETNKQTSLQVQEESNFSLKKSSRNETSRSYRIKKAVPNASKCWRKVNTKPNLPKSLSRYSLESPESIQEYRHSCLDSKALIMPISARNESIPVLRVPSKSASKLIIESSNKDTITKESNKSIPHANVSNVHTSVKMDTKESSSSTSESKIKSTNVSNQTLNKEKSSSNQQSNYFKEFGSITMSPSESDE